MADTIGARIRAARESMGLTQSELARAVGAPDPRTVWRWETDKAVPAVDVIAKIADALLVGVEKLIAAPKEETPTVAEG